MVYAADPTHEAQLEVTRSVLRDIGAASVPSQVLLNKVDRLSADEREALRRKHAHDGALLLSAHDAGDVATLRQTLVTTFEARMVEGQLFVPYAKQSLLGEIYESARVLAEEYEESGTRMKVRALPSALARLASIVAK